MKNLPDEIEVQSNSRSLAKEDFVMLFTESSFMQKISLSMQTNFRQLKLKEYIASFLWSSYSQSVRTESTMSDSDSIDARSSWSGSDKDEIEAFSDAMIFRYCLLQCGQHFLKVQLLSMCKIWSHLQPRSLCITRSLILSLHFHH